MAKLRTEDVKHIARLAQLSLTAGEIETFKDQLSDIINYVEQLKEVDTSDVDPTAQTTGLTNIFREDEVDATRMLSSNEALASAPRQHNDFFVVDLILKNKNEQ